MSLKQYYEILGLDEGADQEEIKLQYRKLAMTWHPDRNPDNKKEATEKFASIANAYHVLMNPDDEEYDEDSDDEGFMSPDLFFSYLFQKNDGFPAFFEGGCNCPRCKRIRKSRKSYSFNPKPKSEPTPQENISFETWQPELVKRSENSLILRWDPPKHIGKIETFVVDMDDSEIGGANYREIYRGRATQYEVRNLDSGTMYHFLVNAIDKDGIGHFSRMVSYKTAGKKIEKPKKETKKMEKRRKKKKEQKQEILSEEDMKKEEEERRKEEEEKRRIEEELKKKREEEEALKKKREEEEALKKKEEEERKAREQQKKMEERIQKEVEFLRKMEELKYKQIQEEERKRKEEEEKRRREEEKRQKIAKEKEEKKRKKLERKLEKQKKLMEEKLKQQMEKQKEKKEKQKQSKSVKKETKPVIGSTEFPLNRQSMQHPMQRSIHQPMQQHPIQQPTQPIQQPIQHSIQQPIQQPIQHPVQQQPIQRHIHQPVYKPVHQPIQNVQQTNFVTQSSWHHPYKPMMPGEQQLFSNFTFFTGTPMQQSFVHRPSAFQQTHFNSQYLNPQQIKTVQQTQHLYNMYMQPQQPHTLEDVKQMDNEIFFNERTLNEIDKIFADVHIDTDSKNRIWNEPNIDYENITNDIVFNGEESNFRTTSHEKSKMVRKFVPTTGNNTFKF